MAVLGEGEPRSVNVSFMRHSPASALNTRPKCFPSVHSVEAETRHDASEQVSSRAVVGVYHHLVLWGRVVERGAWKRQQIDK